MGVVGEGSLAI